MFKQVSLDKNTILGTGSVSKTIKPRLISGNKKSPPDMTSVVPYFPAISGKTLSISIDGDVTATYMVTFTGNSMTQVLLDINTVTTSNVTATDASGYLLLTCEHAGGRNLIKITGGDSLTILGFEQDPHPASVSYAGEIDSLPTFYENRLKGSVPILNTEIISKEVLNRLAAGVSYVLDVVMANLEKEIAIPKEYSVTMAGTSFTIASDDRFYLNVNNIATANPGDDVLENAMTILDSNNNLVYDSSGNRVRLSNVTYGTSVDPTTTFTAWGTANGRSVFGGLTHWQKVKSSRTITNIVGNTLTCTGGTFVTDKVQSNDVIVISGATNTSPYNPNGEYAVDEVINNEIIKIRPKATLESTLISSFTPTGPNNTKLLGEVYGTATIYLGKFCPMQMKGGNMTFNLNSSLTGTYKVILPIGRTTKTLLQNDLPRLLSEPNGGQIELGSKLITTLANALKPRIIAKPNADTPKTLLLEMKNGTIGCRFYSLLAGGLEIVWNGKWDGAMFVKDDGTKDIFYMKQSINGMSMGSDTLNVTVDPVTGKIIETFINYIDFYDGTNTILSIPKYDGTIASNLVVKPGLRLGTGFTTDTPALVPKIEYTVNTGANKYTLLSETLNSSSRKREYVMADGTSVTTLNAKWDGTQWIKDAVNFSEKLVRNIDGLYEFVHSRTVTPFSDTSWTAQESLKYYVFDEDFTQRFPKAVDSVGRTIPSFSVEIASNTQSGSNNVINSGILGEIIIQATLANAFNSTYMANKLAIPSTSDFELNIKALCKDRSILSAFDSSNPEGLLLGNWDAATGNTRMLLRAASDKMNWQIQILNVVTDTGIASDSYISVSFKRRNGLITVYVNNSILVTSSSITSNIPLEPEVTLKGTASAINQDIAIIDYVKVWVGLLNR